MNLKNLYSQGRKECDYHHQDVFHHHHQSSAFSKVLRPSDLKVLILQTEAILFIKTQNLSTLQPKHSNHNISQKNKATKKIQKEIKY
jgi:hypothetical protein